MTDGALDAFGARPEPLVVVADVGRSVAFYRDVLGASVEVQWDSYARLRLGLGRIHLTLPSQQETPDKPGISWRLQEGDTLTGEIIVTVSDCRAAYAALLARGARFLSPPTEPPWGNEVRCFLRDPDRHLIELAELHY